MKRIQPAYVATVVVGTSSVLIGCGQPDFSTMRPTVWKPTAQVLVVDHPQHWNDASIVSMATGHGVTVNVQHVSSAQVVSSIQTAQTNTPVGFVAVLTDGPIQNAWVSASQLSSNSTRFEFIGSTAQPMSSNQVKQVVPNVNSAGYILGWLAGQYDSMAGNAPIGWITDGTTTVKQTTIQSALGGAYLANTLVQFMPISLSQATTIPQIVVATRKLTPAEWQLMQTNGCKVVSLCPQDSTSSVLGQPAAASENVLDADFQAYAGATWKPGLFETNQPPFAWLNTLLVPATIQTTFQTMQNSLASGISPLQQWNVVPAGLKQNWGPIVQSGRP